MKSICSFIWYVFTMILTVRAMIYAGHAAWTSGHEVVAILIYLNTTIVIPVWQKVYADCFGSCYERARRRYEESIGAPEAERERLRDRMYAARDYLLEKGA